MAKNTIITRTIDIPVASAYRVVSSDDYLLTLEEREDSEVTVVRSDIDRRDDGSVVADVAVEFLATPSAEAEEAASDTGQGVGEAAQGAEARTMRISQQTEVSALSEDGFKVHTSMPLPGGMGQMDMDFSYLVHSADEGRTVVKTKVVVDVPVAGVGDMIAAKMIEGSEATVDRGLARVVRAVQG